MSRGRNLRPRRYKRSSMIPRAPGDRPAKAVHIVDADRLGALPRHSALPRSMKLPESGHKRCPFRGYPSVTGTDMALGEPRLAEAASVVAGQTPPLNGPTKPSPQAFPISLPGRIVIIFAAHQLPVDPIESQALIAPCSLVKMNCLLLRLIDSLVVTRRKCSVRLLVTGSESRSAASPSLIISR